MRFTQTIKILAIILLPVFMVATVLGAGYDRAGTASGQQLLIPVGARSIALGGSNLATVTGVDAVYWNPAGIARAGYAANAMFSRTNYLADIGVNFAAVDASLFGFGHFAFSLKSLDFGEIPITTADNPDGTGGMFTPTFFVGTLSYSRMLTDRISIGATAKLISEKIERVGASGVAFDAGVQYTNFADVRGLDIGVSVKNVGPSMEYDGPGLLRQGDVQGANRPPGQYKVNSAAFELPSNFDIGISYRIPFAENTLSVNYLFRNNNFLHDQSNLGAELALFDVLYLRGGYQLLMGATEGETNVFGPALGGGLNYGFGGTEILVDYSYQMIEYFNNQHTISFSMGFR